MNKLSCLTWLNNESEPTELSGTSTMRSAFRLWFWLTFRFWFHVFDIFGSAFRFQNHICYGLIKTLNVCIMIEQLLYLANQYFERTFPIVFFFLISLISKSWLLTKFEDKIKLEKWYQWSLIHSTSITVRYQTLPE